jgi:hypothetical protein
MPGRPAAPAGSLFDTYVVVDWSASSVPCAGRDSIWIAVLERRTARARPVMRLHLTNPTTRREARERLGDTLVALTARGGRALVGFDFPFGYPSGFARALGLGRPAWRATWDELARLVVDGPDNANNRFEVAAALNRRLGDEPFPFWGCPGASESPYLRARGRRPHGPSDLAERRLADLRAPTAQPVWKLAYTGAAGSQALTGIPVVRALRNALPASRVWPFETGFMVPSAADAQVIFAEVYPSLLRVSVPPGAVRDAVQVESLAREFARRDAAGDLAVMLAGPADLSARARRRVVGEECWILGLGQIPAVDRVTSATATATPSGSLTGATARTRPAARPASPRTPAARGARGG